MADESARADLAAAGEELLAKATSLRDALAGVGDDWTADEVSGVKARLADLATGIDDVIAEVSEDADDADDDAGTDDAAPEETDGGSGS